MIDIHTLISKLGLPENTLKRVLSEGGKGTEMTVGDYLAWHEEFKAYAPGTAAVVMQAIENYESDDRIIEYIDTDKIKPHPDNPRKDVGDVTELAESIKANGIMQNLTVIPSEVKGEYMALIGHRRLAAAKAAGLEKVPCVVVGNLSRSEQVSIMLAENMQRSDLSVMEQADGMQMMLDLGDTVSTIGKKTGLSETTVRRRLSLAEYNRDEVKASLERGATFADFDDIKKIKDKPTRNKLIGMVGTYNYKWEYQRALDAQELADYKQRVVDFLKPYAKAVDDTQGLHQITNYTKAYNNGEIKLPEGYNDSRNYYYRIESWGVVLYTDFTAAENDERRRREEAYARHQAEDNDRRERRSQLAKICENMRNSRLDFMRNFKNLPQGKAVDKLFMIYDISDIVAAVNCEDAIVADDISVVIDTLYPDTKPAEIIVDRRVISHDKLLILNLLTTIGAFDTLQAHDWQAIYHRNAALIGTYKALAMIGYQISDVERSVIDGSNELYYKEGKHDADNKD